MSRSFASQAVAVLAAAVAVGVTSTAFAGNTETKRGEGKLLNSGFVQNSTPLFAPTQTGTRASISLTPFDLTVTQNSTTVLQPSTQLLTGIPAGVYTNYTVSVNWSAISGGPWSNEGLIGLTNQAAITGATFYADPGTATNAASNSNPVTLQWGGYFDTAYDTSASPLYFLAAQTYSPSSAAWNNITVTLDDTPLPPTNTVNFSGDTTGDPTFNRPSSLTTLSGVGTAIEYEVVPFYVNADGNYDILIQPADFDSFGLVYTGSFDPNSPLTNLISAFDTSPSPYVGEPDEATVALLANTQYYIVVTGYEDDFDFGQYTGTISNSAGTAGSPVLGIVPEPMSLSVIGGSLVMVLRRRRAA